jgi:uncharacterized membrane protein
MEQLALVAGYIVVIFVGLLGLIVVWKILTGKIDLKLLISEKEGPASLSRFQFLIFTFVVAMCILVLTLDSGEFPKLDLNILGLMGISGGSYLVSKGIQKSGPEAKTPEPAMTVRVPSTERER